MEIERTGNQIIFKLPSSVDPIGLQRIIDYLEYKEATVDSIVDQKQIDVLAEESKSNWWTENKGKFIK
ncbi:MAG: hypothetical protein JXQ96_16885 [Cyclobacteriaceae bacterium]